MVSNIGDPDRTVALRAEKLQISGDAIFTAFV